MYDARNSTGDRANLVFGVATLVVVSLAFALAWFAGGAVSGDGRGAGAAPISSFSPDDGSALAAAFTSPEEARLLSAMGRLDPAVLGDLEARIAATGAREDHIEILRETTGRLLIDNAEHLAGITGSDINAMLDDAARTLGQVRASNNELCMGATYASFENMSPRQAQREADRLMAKVGLGPEDAHQMSVSWQAKFVDMTARAKQNPVRHGKLTPQDEAAFEGLVMGFMTDPTFVRMAMSNNQADALASVNFCDMGLKVIREIRKLPDGTKARAWASVFDMPEVRQALRDAKSLGF
ncbi:MAG: hypothetical protein AAGH87_08940 [Pseudomonadota bacterium]